MANSGSGARMSRRTTYVLRRPQWIELELYDGEQLADGWRYVLEQGEGDDCHVVSEGTLVDGRAEVRDSTDLSAADCYVTFYPPEATEPGPARVTTTPFLNLDVVDADGKRVTGVLYCVEVHGDAGWQTVARGPLLPRGVTPVDVSGFEDDECRVSFEAAAVCETTTAVAAPSATLLIDLAAVDEASDGSQAGDESGGSYRYIVECQGDDGWSIVASGPIDLEGPTAVDVSHAPCDEYHVTFEYHPAFVTAVQEAPAEVTTLKVELGGETDSAADRNTDDTDGPTFVVEEAVGGRWSRVARGTLAAGRAEVEVPHAGDYRITFDVHTT